MGKIKELLIDLENERLSRLDNYRQFELEEKKYLDNIRLAKIGNYSTWNGKDIYSIHIQGTGEYVKECIDTLVIDFTEDKFGVYGELYDEEIEKVSQDYFDEDNYYIIEE